MGTDFLNDFENIKLSTAIDTLEFSFQLDEGTVNYLTALQLNHGMIPKGYLPTLMGWAGGRYPWGLQGDGVTIFHSDNPAMSPNCYIRVKSEYIQRVGYDAAVHAVVGHLKGLGASGKIARDLKLSRVDLAFDFQRDFSQILDSPLYHIRTKIQTTNERREGGRLGWKLWGVGGSTGYKVRVYDKGKEVREVQGKGYWLPIWEGQGFDLSGPIWRVEFELRRKFLKTWKVRSFGQFLKAQLSIQKRVFDLWSIGFVDDRVQAGKSDRMVHIPEFAFLIEHHSEEFRKNSVDRRPDDFERASNQLLSRAVNALVSSAVSSAAAFFARGKSVGSISSLIFWAKKQFRLLLAETALESPESFQALVTEALQKKGHFFTPLDDMTAPA